VGGYSLGTPRRRVSLALVGLNWWVVWTEAALSALLVATIVSPRARRKTTRTCAGFAHALRGNGLENVTPVTSGGTPPWVGPSWTPTPGFRKKPGWIPLRERWVALALV